MNDAQPLSPAQTEIWHLQQRRPDSPCCWIGEYLAIAGAIDPARFADALRRVTDAIPALHANFAMTPDGPRRHDRAPAAWTLTVEDVSASPEPRAAAEAHMRAMLDSRPGMTGPKLFAFALYRVAPSCWYWFAGYHHIVIDGAGAHRLALMLAQAYRAQGAPINLPPDRPGTRPGPNDEAADYWRARLADWSGPIRLGGRSAEPGGRALRCPVPVSPHAIAALRHAASGHRLALSTVLTALVALWTNALDGATDVVIGMAVRGRDSGPPRMLSNVVPLRLHLDRASTALSLAREIARQRRAGRRHESYRGERILRAMAPLDARSFGPTVNIMPFDYGLTFDGNPVTAHNLSIGPVDDLCVTIYDRNDGTDLRIDLDANQLVYRSDHLAGLAARLARLIQLVADDPALPASRIDLLSQAERHLQLEVWNATDRPIPPAGIFDLFARHACAAPTAPCIDYAGTVSDYGTIDRDSGLIGHLLAQLGVRSGALVAILLPRSAAFLTVLLAITRIGAAFVPLDPGNPADRLALMIADASPVRVVTTQALAASLPPATPTLLLDDPPTLHALAALHLQSPAAPVAPPPDPAALAYAIFTSGTTGRPKAVLVPHRGIASLAAFQVSHLGLSAASRVLQFAAVGFDAVIMEVLMAFAAGACLYLPMEPERHGPALGAFLARHRITHALLPPVALAALDPATQSAPQTLVVGGEACPPEIAAAWSQGRRMINAYGPTEATICTTMSDPLTPDAPPAIGKPIWNTRAYVLDRFDRLVPQGVAGELHLAGDSVAIGYLGDPAATEARFVACPFRPGQRMFRTGDRARFSPEGSLDCLGRADRQVKLRGIRIELGEIEAALARRAGVAQSVVIAASGSGAPRLIAYVVAAAGARLDAAVLRAELAAALPPAMIPSAFVVLPALPLTRHGKIDHAALPAPAIGSATDALNGAPRSPSEILIASLFAELLRREPVGREDHFFELGGDSLSATLLCVRLRDLRATDIGIGDVFACPTVAALALRLDGAIEAQMPPLAVMLPLRNISGHLPSLFCIHTGPGLGWPYAALLRHLDPDQPLHAIQARGLDGRTRPATDLAALADDYAAEIRLVQADGPYRLLGWSSGGPLAHLVATHLQASGAAVDLLVSLDGYPAGPHYRAGVPQHPGAADRRGLRTAIEAYLGEFQPGGLRRADILDDAVIAAMLDIHCNTGQLLAAANSGVFQGDLHLFTCREPYHPTPMPPPTIWHNFVTGTVHVTEIDCHHDRMLTPEPAQVIGGLIRRIIARL